MTNQQYLTTQEAANILRVSKRTILRWVEKGKIDSFKVSGTIRIPVTEIPTYIREEQHDTVTNK